MAGAERYRGQVVVVTGGGSGIGRALGAELARAGAVVVLADVDLDAVRAAAAAIGGSCEGQQLDVRDREAWAALVDDVEARLGPIELLCSNAGISLGGPTHELSGAHWDRIVDINLGGVVNGILTVYPRMLARGRGQIVNTASGAGLAAPPFVTAYATTKHAVVGLSTALRPEAALHGVGVSVLCPGSIDTAILDRPQDPDLPATASAPVTGREYLTLLKQTPTSVDAFARKSVRQIAKGTGVIVVPAQAKALWYLARLSPGLLERALVPIARRVERQLVRPGGDAPSA